MFSIGFIGTLRHNVSRNSLFLLIPCLFTLLEKSICLGKALVHCVLRCPVAKRGE